MLGMMMVQRQAIEQRQLLVQGIGLDAPGDWGGGWADGSEESLETLLTKHPQITEGEEDGEEILHYLLSGGWSAEMMTGKKREHHDLDVITLKRVPFSFRLDEQKPTSYFETISMTAEEMLEGFVTTVDWVPSKYKEQNGELKKDAKKYIVYVPVPEYIFISKISGFMREPREKDYADLEALAQVIENKGESLVRYDDVLRHMPGIDQDITRNRKLFKDLGCDIHDEPSVLAMAAWYLTEIVGEYKEGHSDSARKKAARFHSALQDIYENGLRNTHSANALGIRADLYEKSWSEGRLEGFWRGENGNIELRIFNNRKNKEEETLLKVWQRAEDISINHKIESVERYNLTKGKGSILVAEAAYGEDQPNKFLFSARGRFIGQYHNFSEIDGTISYGKRGLQSCVHEIFLSNGKMVGSFIDAPNPQNLHNVVDLFLERKDYKAVLALRKAYGKTSTQRIEIDGARRWHYQQSVHMIRLEEAAKIAKALKLAPEEKGAAIAAEYDHLIRHYGLEIDRIKRLRESGIFGDEMELAAIPQIHANIVDQYRRGLSVGHVESAEEIASYYNLSPKEKAESAECEYKDAVQYGHFDAARAIRGTGLVADIAKIHSELEEKISARYREMLVARKFVAAESFADEYSIDEDSRRPPRATVYSRFISEGNFDAAREIRGIVLPADLARIHSELEEEIEDRYEMKLQAETFEEAEALADELSMTQESRSLSRRNVYIGMLLEGEFEAADLLRDDNPSMLGNINDQHAEALAYLFEDIREGIDADKHIDDRTRELLKIARGIRLRGIDDEAAHYFPRVQEVYDKIFDLNADFDLYIAWGSRKVTEDLGLSPEDDKGYRAEAMHKVITKISKSHWKYGSDEKGPYLSKVALEMINHAMRHKIPISEDDAYIIFSKSDRCKRKVEFMNSQPEERRISLFCKHPEMLGYTSIRDYDVPLTPETREAGKGLFKAYLLKHSCTSADEMAGVLLERFGITREELMPIWTGTLYECLEEGRMGPAKNHLWNIEHSGWFDDMGAVNAEMARRLSLMADSGKYRTAAYTARDLLKDADLARKYIIMHYEKAGKEMTIHSKMAFGID